MKNKLRSSEVPDITLERYHLGELPKREMSSLSEAINSNNELKFRLNQIAQSNRNIYKNHSPKVLGHNIQVRAREQRPQMRIAFPGWLTPVLTGCLALVTLHFLPEILLDQELTADHRLIIPDSRIKGLEPSIKLFRKTESGSELLDHTHKAKEGDLIRLGYQAAGALHGAIISIDSRGVVTPHHPRNNTMSIELKSGDIVLLDYSYELDDAPYWEHFYFITSQKPFVLQPVLEAAGQIDMTVPAASQLQLKIDSDMKQFVFSLQKEVHK